MNGWLEKADPRLPIILTAHASVQGAKYGSERTVMLGADLVLPGSLVRDARLDYVALGHIHKPQDLNENAHPPVIYPGSIERVDFGEAGDDKFFIIAEIEKGHTRVEWRKLDRHPPIHRPVCSHSSRRKMSPMRSSQPCPLGEELADAIVRLTVDYLREWDTLIDEPALRRYTEAAFEFHLIKHPQIEARIRLPADQTVEQPQSARTARPVLAGGQQRDDADALQKLAKEIIEEE